MNSLAWTRREAVTLPALPGTVVSGTTSQISTDPFSGKTTISFIAQVLKIFLVEHFFLIFSRSLLSDTTHLFCQEVEAERWSTRFVLFRFDSVCFFLIWDS